MLVQCRSGADVPDAEIDAIFITRHHSDLQDLVLARSVMSRSEVHLLLPIVVPSGPAE